MASTIQALQRSQRARQPWPPDDTEESVVGTDFHQMTITNLRVGITIAALAKRRSFLSHSTLQ